MRKRLGLFLIMLIYVMSLAGCGSDHDNATSNSFHDKEVSEDSKQNKAEHIELTNLTWFVRDTEYEDEIEFLIVDEDINPKNYYSGDLIDYVEINAELATGKLQIRVEPDYSDRKDGGKYSYSYITDEFSAEYDNYTRFKFIDGGISFSLYTLELGATQLEPDQLKDSSLSVAFKDDRFGKRIYKAVYASEDIIYIDSSGNAEPSIVEGNDYGIDFVTCPYDDEYFAPATDDYIISVDNLYSENEGGKLTNQWANLISFDTEGNMVQFVTREYHVGLEVTSENYYDQFNEAYDEEDVPYSRRVHTFNDKLWAIIEQISSKNKYYISKPLTSDQTNGKAICSEEDVFLPEYEALLSELGVTDDYYISQYHYHEDEYISKHLIRYENYEPIEQQVRNYADIDYEKVSLYSFDADGYTTHNISIFVFADEAGIDNWLKKMYGAYYDGGYVGDYVVDASLPKDFKFEDTSYTGRKGNLLYKVNEVKTSDEKGKWTFELGKTENHYFSKQFLTDRQLKNALHE